MSEPQKCERCEEPAEKVTLDKVPLIGRFTGNAEVQVTKRTIHLRSIRQRLSPWGAYERPEFFRTEVTLCDQCWGAFLSWATEPGQERAKIAAENRRKNQHLLEVAERRREEQVQRHMREQQ